MKKIILLVLFLLVTLCSCNMQSFTDFPPVYIGSTNTPALESTSEPTDSAASKQYEGKLRCHFIDVGQGDSIFIELPNGKCMLIDSGERDMGTRVISYINDLGYYNIDYIVITHAHSDHMGAMSDIISSFSVGKIYMTKAGNNTSSYEKLLQSISDKGLKVHTAKAGVTMFSEEDLSAEIISPSKEYQDLNNTSAVILLTFGKTKFLFMGDAERDAEKEITADVNCNVIKVGHHGSNTSSSYEFIAKTHAKHAVFSVGEGNDYGHPKQQILNRWTKAGAKIWRTDLNGTVIATSNGSRVTVKAEKNNAENTPTPTAVILVLNTKTKKIHTKDCEHVKEIQPENYKETTKNVYALIEQGYTPCYGCNPHQ